MNELLRKGRGIIGEGKLGSYQYFPEEYWTDTNDEEWGMENRWWHAKHADYSINQLLCDRLYFETGLEVPKRNPSVPN